MLNFETTLQDSKSYGDITLSEVEPILKINLRSNKREFSTKIGKLLSIIPPIEANTSSSNEDYSILWLSPDEWLIYSNNKTSYKQQNLLEENLYNNIEIICENNKIKIFVNKEILKQIIYKNDEISYSGILIGPDTKARVKYFFLNTDLKQENKSTFIKTVLLNVLFSQPISITPCSNIDISLFKYINL